MNEQKIEDLKNALREIIQLVTARGVPLSSEMKKKLAQVMDHVADRIQVLRQEEQAPITPIQEPELQASYPSSNVHSFGYDPENGRLLVKFQGDKGYGQGSVYAYSDVPKVIFELFRKGAVPARTTGSNKWGRWWKGKVPSVGASLFTLIKNGNYQYQKLS